MELTILSGRAHPELAKAIARGINRDLGGTRIASFADGELDVQLLINVRQHHVVIIQSTPPPAENWIELFLLVDAAQRSSVKEITVVMPYMGYARQDRKDASRKPISAARMLKLLVASGADRVLTIDVHSSQTQGMIDEPFDNLFFSAELLRHVPNVNWRRVVLVSPDAGGVARCRAIAKRLGCPVALIDKRRDRANVSEVMNVVGSVRGRDAILLDDMVDTAGSLVKAADAVLGAGARTVSACCTHPVLSLKSIPRLRRSRLSTLVVSDTIPVSKRKKNGIGRKLRIASCAAMLGEAIMRINAGESLSQLFDDSLNLVSESS